MAKGQKRTIRANRPDWRAMAEKGHKQKVWIALKGGEQGAKPK